ncbi:hypothetical protein HPB50_013643 [Hyalomma asiaticum]|uniref:Uncharacterized protein n=1 Tax=Hyalomma asiaticum TaxID=266040 RepID=A0ACB7RML2_HYAAI|nr:hypothetical protein HPB50_013643 [Hyalomma asiaticum]
MAAEPLQLLQYRTTMESGLPGKLQEPNMAAGNMTLLRLRRSPHGRTVQFDWILVPATDAALHSTAPTFQLVQHGTELVPLAVNVVISAQFVVLREPPVQTSP